MGVFAWENRKLGENLLKFFEDIGNFVLKLFHNFIDFYLFSVVCFLSIFNPKTYNPASRKIIIEQIYFISLEILPVFIWIAILFGAVFMGFVVDLSLKYSLQSYLSNIIVQFVVVDFIPFFLALFISLRNGLRIGTRTAIMKVNHELNALKAYNIDIVNYQFSPRAIAGMMGFLSLAILFSVIMILSGYVFMFFSVDMDFTRYISSLVKVVAIRDIFIFVFKSLFYGFIIIIMPSYFAQRVRHRYIEIPANISRTMVTLFATIFLVEVVSLTIQFI